MDSKKVILLVGLTKAKKTSIARIFSKILKADIIEMSTPFREAIEDEPTLNQLLLSLNDYRREYGKYALANEALRQIHNTKSKNIILVGLRNFQEYIFLKSSLKNIITIFVYSSKTTRYNRLSHDETSIAKNIEDYELLDRLAINEEIDKVALSADYLIVNEFDYPITLYEQIINFIKKNYKDYNMNNNGITITKLPIYEGKQDNMEIISRLIKPKGELSTISIDQINYLAYVDFPLDGEPRANHFHEEKEESLYLIKGKVKLFVRRGGHKDEKIEEYIIEEGSLINIKPGFAHAYITIEEGFAIEFSSSSYEIITKDKVRDIVI